MTLDPIDRDPPPEHDAHMVVQGFISAVSQLTAAFADRDTRRHISFADEEDILKACAAVYRIEDKITFGPEPVLTAAE
jgi:hypothetical protein